MAHLDEFKLAGIGKDETTHPAVGIDHTLKVGEEFGDALDFIEDSSIRDLAEECARILGGESTGIWIFEREVSKIRGEDSGECGFSRLPGACDGQNREAREALTSSLRNDT